MSNTMPSPEGPTWSSRPSTNDRFAYSAGPVLSYEESGTSSRRAHSHNGYSSGFSPSRSQWREPDAQLRVDRPVVQGGR
jgi:hypothetical protein